MGGVFSKPKVTVQAPPVIPVVDFSNKENVQDKKIDTTAVSNTEGTFTASKNKSNTVKKDIVKLP